MQFILLSNSWYFLNRPKDRFRSLPDGNIPIKLFHRPSSFWFHYLVDLSTEQTEVHVTKITKKVIFWKKISNLYLFRWGAIFWNFKVAVSNIDDLRTMLKNFKCHQGVAELLQNLEDKKNIASLLAVAISGLAIKVFWPRITKIQEWS